MNSEAACARLIRAGGQFHQQTLMRMMLQGGMWSFLKQKVPLAKAGRTQTAIK